jgi:hypothetical protein
VPDRYPAIEDHAVIGDLHTVALVATHGTIDWCCLRGSTRQLRQQCDKELLALGLPWEVVPGRDGHRAGMSGPGAHTRGRPG